MATGPRPFTGETSASVFDAILHRRPSAVRLNNNVPGRTGKIISKALEKDRELRYQSASEIRADLKRLKRDTDSRTSAVAEELPRSTKRLGWLWPALGGGLLFLLIVAGVVLLESPARLPNVTGVTQITHDGLAFKQNIVTDGTRVYFSAVKGEYLVIAEAAAGAGETAILNTGPLALYAVDISSDGSEILAVNHMGTDLTGSFWSVPLPTGTPRQLDNITGKSGAWSRDGQWLVYVRGSDVYLARRDGSDSRKLVSVAGQTLSPAFSPDGERIRFTIRDISANAMSLWEVKRDGTDLHRLFPGWGESQSCCGKWSHDGSYYIFRVGAGDVWASKRPQGCWNTASRRHFS